MLQPSTMDMEDGKSLNCVEKCYFSIWINAYKKINPNFQTMKKNLSKLPFTMHSE